MSFLELFYDLVFVVVIARASHTLAHHVSWRGLGEYVVIFGLIWIAWLNGTLHGTGFALTYAALLLVLSWLWYTVRRQDSSEYATMTGLYLGGMLVSAVMMTASAALPDDARTGVWAVVALGWVVGGMALSATAGDSVSLGMGLTDSMVERFGLFTIIVLGEVVVGMVDGLSEVERTVRTVATGVLALMIGFGFWWTYFDFVGGRLPRRDSARVAALWMYSHLPLAIAIAAAGAAMVGLLEHAGDDHTPQATAWLLAGSVAAFLVMLTVTTASLDDDARPADLYRPLSAVMVAGALAALAVGWWAPVPWLLSASLALILSLVWFFAVDRSLRLGRPDGETGLPF